MLCTSCIKSQFYEIMQNITCNEILYVATKYCILYTLNILYFEGWKSGIGNRKSTKSAGNCQAVSILKPLLKGI